MQAIWITGRLKSNKIQTQTDGSQLLTNHVINVTMLIKHLHSFIEYLVDSRGVQKCTPLMADCLTNAGIVKFYT